MKQKLLTLTSLLLSLPAFAATPIDLALQSPSFLLKTRMAKSAPDLQETSRSLGLNQTLHVRVQQTYQGIPVFGGDAVIHYPNQRNNKAKFSALINNKTSMNGIIYDKLNTDLHQDAATSFTEENALKAKNKALLLYKDHGSLKSKHVNAVPLVFIDEKNEAHWAYKVSFTARSSHKLTKPTYILDAQQQTVYQFWDDMKTIHTVSAGGFIGNHKTGKKELNGTTGHLPAFEVKRDDAKQVCLMSNNYVHVKNYKTNKTMEFACKSQDPDHNQLYWNGNHDQIETTWSPSNDVMFGVKVGIDMFQSWYNMPILKKNNKPMLINVWVHDPDENGYWDGRKAVFGDSVGSSMFNPFTQLDTVVHELAHGFTEQHSNLHYYEQSGGLNESFSDMAGIVAEYYVYGKTDFLVGLGDVKAAGKALRYMSKPSLDCNGGKPGDFCSIDHMGQFTSSLDVHFSSGIFNRVYYELSQAKDWDPKKAFDVMVQANQFYWTARTTFAQAACGVIKAAQDYHYDRESVTNAFNVVGIDTAAC